MSKYDDLVTKLREIFQIDRPELDFGIYRILNARADEINDYLSTRLKDRVAEALAEGAAANTGQLQRDLDEAVKAATALGMSPDDAPKVKELRAALAASSAGASDHENAVFSHLLTFFSRYYDKGDFISQRRYKGDTYAIPYSGEEVVLHWANRDQYYTKSGEAFSNYSFKLEDGRRVHFRLVAADTAKDNRKDNDKERRFALAEARTITQTDEDGEPYEEAIVPVSEEDGDLIVRFEYRTMPKGTKQESLVDAAVEAVLADDAVKARWLALTERAPTDKKPQRTLLEKHLTTYTQKNTADYFIHKDLGGFLGRELDFYIKNEVMNLDDVQNAESFGAIEKQLRMIQCLRAIALDLITFLATVEDFQKKLWLKKKFVVSAHYCMTLDRVPEALYPTIAANPAQWEQWHALGLRDNASPGTGEELKARPFRMVDTALFDASFRATLLKAIPDLDATTDGLLVHGDNFQALTALTERYRESVRCIYIDPPYNTDGSPIAYKNGYKKSSWNALIESRLKASMALLSSDGLLCALIDDFQRDELAFIMRAVFGDDGITGTVAIRSNPSGRPVPSGFAQSHEYAIFGQKSDQAKLGTLPRSAAQLSRYRESDSEGRYMWELFRKRGSASLRTDRRPMYYPLYYNGSTIRIPEMRWDPDERDWTDFEPLQPGERALWPIDEGGNERRWRWSPARVKRDYTQFKVKEEDGVDTVYYKYRPQSDSVLPPTVWIDAKYSATEHGTDVIKDFFGTSSVFDYPKSIHAVHDCVLIGGGKRPDSIIMDYFAGSGTTAQAVIAMNRADGGKRKYVLAEQGSYFDTVLKPRIQKVTFSTEWHEGVPTTPETGISHAFKVLKIESYEDALNNLALKRSESQGALLERMGPEARNEYLMRYMLDVEARGSLLSVEDFLKPFDYRLNIATDSAGAFEPCAVDLIETFNYLIGLTVRHVDIQLKQGFATVEGTLPTGEKTLVLWRDADLLDYEGLAKLCDKLAINPADSEYDVVYINGDHNIPSVLTSSEEEGEVTKTLRLRQIEPEFLERMFGAADA